MSEDDVSISFSDDFSCLFYLKSVSENLYVFYMVPMENIPSGTDLTVTIINDNIQSFDGDSLNLISKTITIDDLSQYCEDQEYYHD